MRGLANDPFNGGDGGRVQSRCGDHGPAGILQQLINRSLAANLAAVENHHAITDILDIIKLMTRKENGLAASTKVKQQVFHLA